MILHCHHSKNDVIVHRVRGKIDLCIGDYYLHVHSFRLILMGAVITDCLGEKNERQNHQRAGFRGGRGVEVRRNRTWLLLAFLGSGIALYLVIPVHLNKLHINYNKQNLFPEGNPSNSLSLHVHLP